MQRRRSSFKFMDIPMVVVSARQGELCARALTGDYATCEHNNNNNNKLKNKSVIIVMKTQVVCVPRTHARWALACFRRTWRVFISLLASSLWPPREQLFFSSSSSSSLFTCTHFFLLLLLLTCAQFEIFIVSSSSSASASLTTGVPLIEHCATYARACVFAATAGDIA